MRELISVYEIKPRLSEDGQISATCRPRNPGLDNPGKSRRYVSGAASPYSREGRAAYELRLGHPPATAAIFTQPFYKPSKAHLKSREVG
jgi:hypothetical protein